MRSQEELKTTKKSYCSPEISVIGKISDITEMGNVCGKQDGTSDCGRTGHS
jgi:hypothetical protein